MCLLYFHLFICLCNLVFVPVPWKLVCHWPPSFLYMVIYCSGIYFCFSVSHTCFFALLGSKDLCSDIDAQPEPLMIFFLCYLKFYYKGKALLPLSGKNAATFTPLNNNKTLEAFSVSAAYMEKDMSDSNLSSESSCWYKVIQFNLNGKCNNSKHNYGTRHVDDPRMERVRECTDWLRALLFLVACLQYVSK